jgi:hypothetical protein
MVRARVTSLDEIADKLARKDTALLTAETPLQAETMKKTLESQNS